MRRLGRTLLDLVEVHLPALFLVLLSSSIVLQVILRYVFHSPSPALFELAGYSFIWVIFLGAPLARRYRSHIRFDIIYQWLPRKVQLIVDLILDLFFTVALAACVRSACDGEVLIGAKQPKASTCTWQGSRSTH